MSETYDGVTRTPCSTPDSGGKLTPATPSSKPLNISALFELLEPRLTEEGVVQLPPPHPKTTLNHSEEPGKIVRLTRDCISKGGFELRRELDVLSIVAEPHIPARQHECRTEENVDSTKPADAEKQAHGISIAASKTRDRFLGNAILARMELNWSSFYTKFADSNFAVRQQYIMNALFLCLLGGYDNRVELLQLDHQDWCQRILYAQHNWRNLPLPHHLSYISPEDLELQIISLLSELLRVSDGKVVDQQGNPVPGVVEDISPRDNLILYNTAFGFRTPTAKPFGVCSRNELQKVLSGSRCFVQVKDRKILRLRPDPDVRDSISCLWTSLKVDYPEGYFSLPSELQNEINSEQVKRIMMYIELDYRKIPCLRQERNNLLLLLLSSSKYAGRALGALQTWALSEGGRFVYDDLIHAALLSLVRLGFSPSEEQCIRDFSSLLGESPSRNAQENLKHMTYFFRNVLIQFSMNSEMILQLLEDVIDISQSTIKDGNRLSNSYWTRRLFPLQDHDTAPATFSEPGTDFQPTEMSSLKTRSTETAGKDIAMTELIKSPPKSRSY